MDNNDGKTAKSSKHGGRPSRALTAYNFYFHDQRQKLQEQLLQLNGQRPTYTQISRFVSQNWKKLSDSEHAYYEGLATKDKRRYALELVRSLEEETTVKNQDHHSVDGPETKPRDTPALPSTVVPDSSFSLYSYGGVNPYSPSLQAMLRQSIGDHTGTATLPSSIAMNPEMISQIHLLSFMMIDYVKRVAPEKLDVPTEANSNSYASTQKLNRSNEKTAKNHSDKV